MSLETLMILAELFAGKRRPPTACKQLSHLCAPSNQTADALWVGVGCKDYCKGLHYRKQTSIYSWLALGMEAIRTHCGAQPWGHKLPSDCRGFSFRTLEGVLCRFSRKIHHIRHVSLGLWIPHLSSDFLVVEPSKIIFLI